MTAMAAARGAGRTAALRAELIKLVKRPAVRLLALAAAAYMVMVRYVFAYVHYLSVQEGEVASGVPASWWLHPLLPGEVVRNTLGSFALELGAVGLVLGAVVAGVEHQWGTLTTVYSQRGGRLRVAVAQILAVWMLVAAYVAALFGVGLAVGGVLASVEGASLAPPPATELAGGVAVAWLVVAMWTTLGLLLGTVLRSAAAAAAIGVTWMLAVEGIVMSFAGRLGPLAGLVDALPGANAVTLTLRFGPPGGTADTLVDGPVSGDQIPFVVAAYLLAFAVASVLALRSRDVD